MGRISFSYDDIEGAKRYLIDAKSPCKTLSEFARHCFVKTMKQYSPDRHKKIKYRDGNVRSPDEIRAIVDCVLKEKGLI